MRKPKVIEAVADKVAEPGPPTSVRQRSKRSSDDLDAALGARIRAARLATGVTLKVLGRALGVSYQQVQKYESGKSRMAVSTLIKISAALNVHPGSFFDADMTVPVDKSAEAKTPEIATRDAQREPVA